MTTLLENVHIVPAAADDADHPHDVFIAGDRISAIGEFPGKRADTVIDGQGGYLAAGFIDIHSEYDHYGGFFSHRGQEEYLLDGVTTIVVGSDGVSLAPSSGNGLHAVASWGRTRGVNADWQTVSQLLTTLNRGKYGTNVATFVGAATARREVTREKNRSLNGEEIAMLSSILKRALNEGAAGISVYLPFFNKGNVSLSELTAVFACAGRARKPVVIVPFWSDHETLFPLDKLLKARSETDVRLAFDLVEAEDFDESACHALRDAASRENIPVLQAAGGMRLYPLWRLLPAWVKEKTVSETAKRIADPWIAERLLPHLSRIRGSRFIVAEAPSHDNLVGHTLEEIQEMFSLKDVRRALLRLMHITGLEGTLLRVLDPLSARDPHPRAIPSALPLHAVHPALRRPLLQAAREPQHCFTRLLADASSIPARFEEAVRSITEVPAAICRLENRGAVREGYVADLVILNHNCAVSAVLVNGQVAVLEGRPTPAAAGRVLRI